MKADKPLLHQVASSNDPELYCEDLDWYFNCYDAECGLKSAGLSGALEQVFDSSGNRHRTIDETANPITVNLSGGAQGASGNPNPWATAHHLKAFRRGRQIWRRFTQLPYRVQCGLRSYYEPRQTAPNHENWGTKPMDEKLVRYYHMFWLNNTI